MGIEPATIGLKASSNQPNLLVNVTLVGDPFPSGSRLNQRLSIGANLIRLNVTAQEFAPLGLNPLSMNITRLGHLLAYSTNTTELRAAYVLSGLSASPYTMRGGNCTVNLEVCNNRSGSIPVNITLSASGWGAMTYRNVALQGGMNQLYLNITAPSLIAEGIYQINVSISRLGHLLALNSTSTNLRAPVTPPPAGIPFIDLWLCLVGIGAGAAIYLQKRKWGTLSRY